MFSQPPQCTLPRARPTALGWERTTERGNYQSVIKVETEWWSWQTRLKIICFDPMYFYSKWNMVQLISHLKNLDVQKAFKYQYLPFSKQSNSSLIRSPHFCSKTGPISKSVKHHFEETFKVALLIYWLDSDLKVPPFSKLFFKVFVLHLLNYFICVFGWTIKKTRENILKFH